MEAADKKQFYKELAGIALPVALQNLMLALLSASDAIILGKLTQASVAAVSLASEVQFVMNLFLGTVIGGAAILAAQYWGKGDKNAVKLILSSALRCNFVISLLFFAAAFFAPEALMRLYTTDAELIFIGAEYLKIVSFSYLLSGVSQCYLCVMKVTGRAKKSAAIAVLAVAVDVTADVFFVYGLCGLPKLGSNGSALSTVVVCAAELIWVLIDSYKKGNIRPSRRSLFTISKPLARDLWKIDAPVLVSALVWGVGFSAYSAIMGRMGGDAAAAYSIAAVIKNLISCLCMGLGSGAGIMIGGLLGKNALDAARRAGARLSRLSLWCGLASAALVIALSPLIASFFILSETAAEYLRQMLAVCAAYLFAKSINVIVVCGIFPAGGDTRYDAISVALSMWLFAIPLGAVAAFALKWPVIIVYIIISSDEIIKIPWIYPRYRKYLWLKNLTREDGLES